MTDLSVPYTIVAGLVGAAAAWGAARAEISGLRRDLAELKRDTADRLLRHDTILDDHGRKVHEIDNGVTGIRTRVSDISELKATVVTQREFVGRMNAQDDALRELRIAVDRKASLSTLPAAPAIRPRAPSRPDR